MFLVLWIISQQKLATSTICFTLLAYQYSWRTSRVNESTTSILDRVVSESRLSPSALEMEACDLTNQAGRQGHWTGRPRGKVAGGHAAHHGNSAQLSSAQLRAHSDVKYWRLQTSLGQRDKTGRPKQADRAAHRVYSVPDTLVIRAYSLVTII